MSTDPRRPAPPTDPVVAAEQTHRKWSEIRHLADVLSHYLEENHLSPKIARLYEGR